MGILGTSSQEEARLRAAAGVASGSDSNLSSRRQSGASYTDSSAYETAEEGDNNDDAISVATDVHLPGAVDDVNTIHADDDVHEPTQTHDVTAVSAKIAHNGASAAGAGATAAASTTASASAAAEKAAENATKNTSEYTEDEPSPFVGAAEHSQAPSEVHSMQQFHADEELALDDDPLAAENKLNRIYTLDRIASRRTIEEACEEELIRALTNVPTNKGKVNPADLTWDLIDDKDNPQNWPLWKKWYITMTVACICLIVSLGSSLFVSGVPEIEKELHVSQELAVSGLTFYLIGLALGPMIAAPLSELVGRKWVYRVSLPVSMLFTMGVGLSKNIESVLVLRFFCGLIASPAMAVAGGSISDIWQAEKVGFAMALFCMAPFLGPILGPIIGNFVSQNKGWEWTMWVSLMFSGALLPFVVFLPETYKPVLLARRAKARGVDLAKPEMNKKYAKLIATIVLVRPFEMLIVEPIVAVLSIYVAFVFAVLFGFFEAFPIIFITVYEMKQGVSGLPFISVGIGLLFGVLFYIYLDKTRYFPKNPDGTRGKRDENGNMIWDAPESRLLIGKVGAVSLPISLFWLGWTARKSVHWIVPTLSGVFFGFGLILVFFTVILYISMSFPPLSVASALAANNFLRYLLAAVFPLFTVQMYTKLHIGWATSLFAFIALIMVPIPFLFEKYGAKLRSKSKYGYAALFKKMAMEKAQKEAEAAAAADSAVQSSTHAATGFSSLDEKTEPVAESKFAPENDTSFKV